MTQNDAEISGERRFRSRRRRFFRYVVIALVASLFAGMVSGTLSQFYEVGLIPVWAPVLACALLVAALVWFTYDYFKRVDELDLKDNLWAHTIGLYGGVIAFGVWYFLADLGLIRSPSALAVVAIMMIVTFAAYGLRKLGWR
ncbi:MAG: hypothetical protein CL808_07035 [Citromicrobium sp.]|nr:hypothetical protein [Citromicrobium sp.]